MKSLKNKKNTVNQFVDCREPDLRLQAEYQGTCKNSSNPCIGTCNRCSK